MDDFEDGTERREGERRGEGLKRSNRQSDPWDYYVESPGKDGVACAGRITPNQKSLIAQIVQSGQTKCRTESDLVRCAVTFFLAEKFGGAFLRGRLAPDIKRMMDYVESANRMGRLYDLERFKNAGRDKVAKLLAIGMVDEAVTEFALMLEIADGIHPKFAKIVRAWAAHEQTFARVAPIVARREARVHHTPEDEPCANCKHPMVAHVDNEGAPIECYGAKGRCGCDSFTEEEEA